MSALLALGCGDDGADDDAMSGEGPSASGADESPGDDGAGGDDPLGMVAAHNDVRSNAEPEPSPSLPDVAWDSDVADVAQEWADRCVFEHSSNGFGENLYIGSGTPSADDAVIAWASEVADYDYDSNSCSGVCGHYTQIVWRDSTRIGCAFADCDSVQGVSFAGRLWVCNYDPPGNFIGERPY